MVSQKQALDLNLYGAEYRYTRWNSVLLNVELCDFEDGEEYNLMKSLFKDRLKTREFLENVFNLYYK